MEDKLKVLILSWEYPPFIVGGLGVYCHNLAKALHYNDVEVTVIIPERFRGKKRFVRLLSTDTIKNIGKEFKPKRIVTAVGKKLRINKSEQVQTKEYIYKKDFMGDVRDYTKKVKEMVKNLDFDIIHCMDRLTAPAAIEAKKISGKPFLATVHSIEHDKRKKIKKSAYEIEKLMLKKSKRLIAVSRYEKNRVIRYYKINQNKIDVVYESVPKRTNEKFSFRKKNKYVLFLGRLAPQKGCRYFLDAAKKVLEKDPNVKFIVAGKGLLMEKLMKQADKSGISNNVIFTGYVGGKDVDRLYKIADVYVVPSVSEPFGLTPLEAISNGCPVIVSNNSGFREIFSNYLRINFSDTSTMANKILAVLRYKQLYKTLRKNAFVEIKKVSWDKIAKDNIKIYKKILREKT